MKFICIALVLYLFNNLSNLNAQSCKNKITDWKLDPIGLLNSESLTFTDKLRLDLENSFRFEEKTEKILFNKPVINKRYNVIPQKGVLVLDGLSGVEKILINGERVEIKDSLLLPAGMHKIKLIAASGYEGKSIDVRIYAEIKTTINGNLKRKTSGKALLRSFFVLGLGQAYQEKRTRSWLYPALFFATVAGSFAILNSYNTAVDDYNSVRDQYSAAYSINKINSLREEMYSAFDNMEAKKNIRNIVFSAAGSVWLLSVLDTILLPPRFTTSKSFSVKTAANGVAVCYTIPIK